LKHFGQSGRRFDFETAPDQFAKNFARYESNFASPINALTPFKPRPQK
jgi:hypothetical protein